MDAPSDREDEASPSEESEGSDDEYNPFAKKKESKKAKVCPPLTLFCSAFRLPSFVT